MSTIVSSSMSSLDLLRSRSTKILLTFLWLQIPTLIALGLFRSVEWQGIVGSMTLMAIAVSIYYKLVGNTASTRYLISVATVLTPALMVFMLKGNEWQLDGHMYFFAVFALLIGLCDWRCIALATIVIAIHHLLLNFTISYALFPDGADFFRVVFHALVVLIEAGVLIWVSFMLAKTLAESDEKLSQVNQAKAQMEILAKEREAAQIQVEISRKDAINQLAKELRTSIGVMADDIERTADIMEISAVTLIDKVESSQSLAKKINANTDETSQTVQMVATAADELNASIKEIAVQSGNSRQISDNANKQAVETDKKVQELTDKANQIGQIVGLISKIAEQTNLLALNATIEAARAGDAGKGFAVVASEVKNLATETAKATENITAQVSHIQHITRDTAAAIKDITKTIQSISLASSAIAGAVEEQSSATADIASNIQFASESTANISANINVISQNIGETNTASANVGDQASNLKNSAIKLRTQLHDFLTKIEKS